MERLAKQRAFNSRDWSVSDITAGDNSDCRRGRRVKCSVCGEMLGRLVLLLFLSTGAVTSSKILGLLPYRGASHFYVFQPLMEALANRGHSVTVVSQHPRKVPLKNYRDISVADPSEPTLGFDNATGYFNPRRSALLDNLEGLGYLAGQYERVLAHPEVLSLANSSFDLVITEMFNSDLFFGLIHKIGAPVIGLSSCTMMPWTADSLAVPNAPGYIPNVIGDHGPSMGLLERLMNTIDVWVSRVYYRLMVQRKDQAIAERYLGPLPDLADIAANTSLLFVNTHFSTVGLRPYSASVIEIGGINVKQPKPLPKDLDSLLNSSNGAIYFSIGSAMVGSSLPPAVEEVFLTVFKSSDKTIFWKREELLSSQIKHIITRPWFPQRDVLAHPKIELFISHCGALGLQEAVSSGVPIICIPLYGDQPLNAKYISEAGFGIYLDPIQLTADTLKAAISQILTNNRFKERAAEVSGAFKDRPMPPLETALYWTEYLLRHGPKPFEGPFKKLSPWQRDGLDIAAIIIAGLGVTLGLPLLILLCVVNRLVRREPLKQTKTKTKKKQN